MHSLETILRSPRTSKETILCLLEKTLEIVDINYNKDILLIAAIEGSPEHVKLLVERGVSPNLDQKFLYGAAKSGKLNLISYFIKELKISAYEVVEIAGNPLSWCITNSNANHRIEYFLSLGVDPNQCSKKHDSLSPLQYAIKLRERNSTDLALKRKIIDLLIQYGGKM